MSARFSRFRFATAAVVSFGAGVIFASGMDWTKISWAQSSGARAPQVRGPMAPEGASFADIAERVTPGVVAVNTSRTARPRPQVRGRAPQGMEDFLEQFGGQQPRQQRGEGSGFILSNDGYIVTNNHVVADADQVSITLSDGRSFRARVIGTDSTTDVAVVKIEARSLPTLTIGNDETTRIGEWVLAVGNPLGLDFTVTAGIISAKGRGSEINLPNSGNFTISDFIQTDAAINPGNSGGPLINMRGEVIGLNSAIASQTGFYSGYGFAIPITLVKNVADALIKDGRVRMPVMGVSVTRVDPEDAGINGLAKVAGVKVAGFNPPDGGPAKDAGIEVGDVIITVDGKPVDRVSSLQRIVRMRRIGDVIPVEVMRFGSKKAFRVKLVDAEAGGALAVNTATPNPTANPAAGKLGMSVEALPEEIATRLRTNGIGVRVSEVADNGPARDKIAAGSDVLLEVLYPAPRRPIRSVNDLQTAIATLKDGDYVSLLVQSLDPRVGRRVVNIRVGD
ncbi:MAG TPA: trypsin-like peptidase domain-containing protein [Gemmatimonas sp.]|uniref:trypsin-like peptidase domain-containing protein n=1 Tax=Gemmatimonas sp. TaxID=1962908 RepID=UPI002ED8C4E9